jgi:hypothetical protein
MLAISDLITKFEIVLTKLLLRFNLEEKVSLFRMTGSKN